MTLSLILRYILGKIQKNMKQGSSSGHILGVIFSSIKLITKEILKYITDGKNEVGN